MSIPKKSRAVCHSFIYGPKNAVTPTNKPAMFSSAPFDTDAMTPIEAMSAAAYQWHKIQPHARHWRIAHTHTLSDKAISLMGKSKKASAPAYSKVFILEYVPERAMRKHRGVNDEELHGFLKSSWYVEETETAQ
jgi:hypothetical protein